MLPLYIEGVPQQGKIAYGDECGRGSGCGSVVAVFVTWDETFVPKTQEDNELLELIKDSKKLSEKQRIRLEPFIKEHALEYAYGIVDNDEIDKINILQATFKAMHKALDQLKTPIDHIVVDGNRFKQYHDIPHTCVVGGDNKLLQIAAASILCKCFRDRIMVDLHNSNDLYRCYEWHKNKGYLTKTHLDAIKENGMSPLHRKTFIHI